MVTEEGGCGSDGWWTGGWSGRDGGNSAPGGEEINCRLVRLFFQQLERGSLGPSVVEAVRGERCNATSLVVRRRKDRRQNSVCKFFFRCAFWRPPSKKKINHALDGGKNKRKLQTGVLVKINFTKKKKKQRSYFSCWRFEKVLVLPKWEENFLLGTWRNESVSSVGRDRLGK